MPEIVTMDDARGAITKSMETRRDVICALLPKHMDFDRLMQLTISAVIKNPKLRECNLGSVVGATIEAAKLGMEPNTPLGHCYLVPFKGKAQLLPGYKGLVMLAHESPKVLAIEARVVYPGDDFGYTYGTNAELWHRVKSSMAEQPSHFYAVAQMKGGIAQFEVMTVAEIEEIRRKAPGGNYGPWVSHYNEMAKKTVARRLCKWLPLLDAGQRAVHLDEAHEVHMEQDLPEVIVEDVKVEEGQDEKKRKRVMILCRGLKVDDDVRHAFCEKNYGVKSTKDMTNDQLDAFARVLADVEAGNQTKEVLHGPD